MSRYRRAKTTGASYFFTVVTYRRQNILCDIPLRTALREAVTKTRQHHPFTIDAWVLLPDHLHCIWTLPEGDADFSMRWSRIKRYVSIATKERYRNSEWLTDSKKKHRESTLWQRRFWEHRIRDQDDFNQHLDYIHYNPVKHGLCEHPAEWPYSTLHRYVRENVYPINWSVEGGHFKGVSFGE